MIDGSSIGLPERSEPGVARSRHISGQRQVSWDLLRSGFVLLVVAYHATYVAPEIHPELAPRPFSFSHQVGASLLLVVSAYFAAATVRRHPTGRYWWGRIARLVPAFLVAVVLAWAAMRYVAPTEWYTPGKRDLVGNLLLLGNWRPQEFPFLDGSYWTLPLQLMAFTVAALLWRSRWGRGRELRVVLWVAALLPLVLWPVRAAGPPEAYRMVADGFGVHRVHLFIAGVAIWMWANGRLTRAHFLALITTCLLGHVMHTLALGPDGWSEDWTATLGVFCGIAVICLAARAPDWAGGYRDRCGEPRKGWPGSPTASTSSTRPSATCSCGDCRTWAPALSNKPPACSPPGCCWAGFSRGSLNGPLTAP